MHRSARMCTVRPGFRSFSLGQGRLSGQTGQPGNSVVETSRKKVKISMKHGETRDFKARLSIQMLGYNHMKHV